MCWEVDGGGSGGWRSIGAEERAEVAGLRGSLEHCGQEGGCCINRWSLRQSWGVELQCQGIDGMLPTLNRVIIRA